ncbi:GntP family permease [Oceanobacillus timonensis]|uniref:GntP family permease n=1 Tax=Oceanobacillus timonensis TaxID=1926285 RepID=UPI0009BBB799|nr:SLC13 family permease [Oceanobacillus timonensis]
MSTGYVLAVFFSIIILMVLAISKFKIHASMALLISGILLGIFLQFPLGEIEEIMNEGFADTIKSVGIVIFLGSVLGIMLERTGGAAKITNSAIKYFGDKYIVWALVFSSALLGIPIWGDTVVVLLIPIVSKIALDTGRSMLSLGTILYLGALVTASLVPPTPGAVAAASLLGVSLGEAIIWGTIISIPSIVVATLYALTLKEHVEPLEEYVDETKKANNNGVKQPSLLGSLAPILLPLILIVGNTAISAAAPNTFIAELFSFIGSPMVALLSGCVLALSLTGSKWNSKEVLDGYVDKGIGAAAMPILVTGLGGVLAIFIERAGVAEVIADTVVSFGFPSILIPIILAAILHIVTGSNALAVMTAAALVQPMLGTLGISPLAAFLASGTGALMFKHANSSGFWVTVTMSNMNVKQGIKGISVASTIAGGVGALITIVLHYTGVI